MGCRKVFWEDPYQSSLSTVVTSVNDDKITVKETIFYSFAGGQESDTGFINEYQVLNAEKCNLEIVYTIDKNHHLETGDKVIITIDWDRRYKLMKLHFAAEIVLELAYKHLTGIEKTGAHISEDKARIDFLWHENISKSFVMLEKEANDLINDNLEIISDFEDVENERRYWEIKGFSKVNCGGTHIRKTGEIGHIKLKRVNLGKGKERIEIYFDEED